MFGSSYERGNLRGGRDEAERPTKKFDCKHEFFRAPFYNTAAAAHKSGRPQRARAK